jgi:MraZ protein
VGGSNFKWAGKQIRGKTLFRGSCETRMDDKSRLKIPSAFRRVIDENFPGGEFFVTSTTGDHARVYPLAVWKEKEEIVLRLPSENRVRKKILYHAYYYGQEQQMDTQGRLLIQAPLRTRAELQGEVIVIAQGNFLEVWNKERFHSVLIEGDPITPEDSQVLEGCGF